MQRIDKMQNLTTSSVSLREGVNFIPKPFDPAHLASAVRICLDTK
jgi:hypothetical protein